MSEWESVSTLEEAKTKILNPHYKQTGEFQYYGVAEGLEFNTVLDFGAGVGRNAKHFVGQGKTVYCYDFPNMRDLAREYMGDAFEKVTWITPPLENLEGLSVDLVIAELVFQHIPELELRRILSVLKKITKKIIVNGRGYLDQGGSNVWMIVLDYFSPLTILNHGDGTDMHQKAVFE